METAYKVILAVDPGNMISGFANAEGAVGKFGASLNALVGIGKGVKTVFDSTVASLQAAGRHARNWGIALSASTALATKGAIDLQMAMQNVAAILPTGSRNIGTYTHSVVELSRQLPLSAKNIAEGFYNVVSSGFAGAEGIRVLATAAKMGVAGLTDTNTAATALISVLNAYGLSASSAGKVSDELFQAVNVGIFSFEQLQPAIGDVVGIAAAAGVPFRDAAAALATMTRSGIDVAESGTSLNRVIQSLLKPTDELAFAWARVSDESITATLSQRGLFYVMEQLRKASGGNVETLLKWFDEVRAARGAFALMANDGKTYAEVQKSMQNSSGATNKAFEEQTKSVGVQIKLMLNQFKSIGIEIGQSLLPAVGAMAKAGTTLLSVWNVLPGPIKTLIAYGGALSSVLLVIAGAAVALWARQMLIHRGFTLISRSMTAAAQSAIATGGVWAKNFGAGVLQSLSAAGPTVSKLIGPFSLLRLIFGGLFGAIGKVGTALTGVFPGLSRFGGAISTVAGHLGRFVGSLASAIRYLPALGIVALGVVSNMQRVSAATKAYRDEIESSIDTKSLTSIDKSLDSVDAKLKKARVEYEKSFNGWSNMAMSAGKKVVNTLTGVVGIELFQDPQEQINRMKILEDANRRLHLAQTYSTAQVKLAYTMLVKDGMMPAAKTQSELHSQIRGLSTAAKDLKFDFSKTLDEKQVEKFVKKWEELKLSVGAIGPEFNQITDESYETFKAMQDQLKKVQESSSATVQKMFEVSGAVKNTGVEGKKEMTMFYYSASMAATEFYNNIETLMQRGLNPAVIMQLIQAGPDAAGAAVKTMVEDTTGGMIQLANKAADVMRDLMLKSAMYARLAQIAINDSTGKAASDMGVAAKIQETMWGLAAYGQRVDNVAVAKALGLSPEDVDRIATEFTLGLKKRVEMKFQEGGQWTALSETMGQQWNWAIQNTKISEDVLNNVFKTFRDKGQAAALDFINALKIPQGEKDILIKFVVDDAKLKEAQTLLQSLNLSDEQHMNVIIDLIGAGPAEAAIAEIKGQITPEEYQIITKLQDMGLTQDQLKTLKMESRALLGPWNINVGVLDNASGMIDTIGGKLRWLVNQDYSVIVHVREQNESSVVPSGSSYVTQDPTGTHGKRVIRSARGGIRFYQEGEHIAQIAPASALRIWAEPETGGEAYIPLSFAKRARSSAILGQVASMFGYGLLPMASGGILSHAARGPAQGTTHKTELNFFGNFFGDQALLDTIDAKLDAHDREQNRKTKVGVGY